MMSNIIIILIQMNMRHKHAKQSLLKDGFASDAINFINSDLKNKKNAKEELEQKIKDSFYMSPAEAQKKAFEQTVAEVRKQQDDKQFLSNHGQQVNKWNKGTLDLNKYKDQISNIEESLQQIQMSKYLIGKKADAMIIDPEAELYNKKIKSMKQKVDMHDDVIFQDNPPVKIESNIEKWKGTGLEEEFKQYQNPVEKRQNKPLFEKSSYMTLDGHPKKIISGPDYQMRGALDASYNSLNESIKKSKYLQAQSQYLKDKILSQSKFFVLKGAEKLPSHYKERLTEITNESKVKVYGGYQGEFQDLTTKKQSKLSEFGRKHEEAKIPLVKNWFESLELSERVLCVSTVDSTLTDNIRDMYTKLKKVPNNESGKFKMINQVISSSEHILDKKAQNTPKKDEKKKEKRYNFNICNSKAYQSSPEKKAAELELLSYVRLTDTFEMHDTITVCYDLLKDPQKFYDLSEKIAGQLFLKTPHDIKFLDGDQQFAHHQYCFESKQPPWLEMSEANSLAQWILYYLERAIFIQYKTNVYGEFVTAKDSQKKPLFIGIDGKYISLAQEMKPFWRTFLEEKNGVEDFLKSLKDSCYSQLGLNTNEINTFSGGLRMQESGQRALIERVERMIEKWDQVDLATVCQNTISESVLSLIDKSPLETAETYKFEVETQKAPMTKSVANVKHNLITKIDVVLERIFIDHFREHINTKLKSRFTSQNKKLQKKKLKKLKQKEQMQEKEREQQIQQEQQEVIKVNNQYAVEMLLGKTLEDDTPGEVINDFSDVKRNKKKKKMSITPQEEVPPQINPQNYFQVFGHKFEESQNPSSKTQSTCEETNKKVKLPSEILQAMSNEEILKLTDYKTGNSQLSTKQWQRASRPLVSDLISEAPSSQVPGKMEKIDVRVMDNLLYSNFERVESSSSSSSKGPHKSIITFKKKPNSKIYPAKRVESSSSDDEGSSDNDEEFLPDLFTVIQPEENDSSDYGGEEDIQGSSEESEMDTSSAAVSKTNTAKSKKKKKNNSHKSLQQQQQLRQIVMKKKRGKKGKTAEKSEFIIDFYGQDETQVEPKIVYQEEKIINRWTKLKDIPTFTCQYVIKEAQFYSEFTFQDPRKNKKNKKQKKIEWESKFAQKEPEIQQIEIIKPVIEVKKDPQPQQPPVIQITKKQKKKMDQKASAEAMNSFIKKIAGQTLEKEKAKEEEVKVEKKPSREPTPEVVEPPKPAPVKKEQAPPVMKDLPPKKAPKQKPQNPQQRLSMVEEVKALSSGYRYEAKKKESSEKQSQSPQKEIEPVQQVKQMSQVVESLSVPLEPPKEVENSEKPQERKKPKKVRSNKNKKKKPIQQNSWIDPITGMEMYSYDQGYQVPALVNNLMQDSGIQQMNFNQQVQDLLTKLNEQVLVQQQKQLQEYQMRQQQEAEQQMLEECQPCQEIDSERYDLFFEQLEQEMLKKVKEIDLLKDSVRKERQGFISIVETIVKNTFTNRYGNGFVGIKIFGSMATELAIETSDVDLVVTGINSIQSREQQYGGGGKNQLLKMMQKLYDNLQFLKEKGQIFKIKFIHGANVPIIKLVVDLQAINQDQIKKAIEDVKREREAQKSQEFQFSSQRYHEEEEDEIDLDKLGLNSKTIDEKMRYLKVDISIDEQSQQFQNLNAPKGHSGIDTIYHIQELVLQRKDLRPIVMIIKKIFDETFLSMPYFGGISSFSLVLMVSAYLKRFDAEKQESLSRNLSGFFHFYGVGFKPHLFYLNGDKIEFCEDPLQRPFQDPFIVLDPLDSSNNISHSTFRIKDIQKALVQAFKIINESCERFQTHQNDQESTPKAVLNKLMTVIREQYQVLYNIYDDDF